MRSGLVIAIVAAVAVVIGGILWFNNQSDMAVPVQQPSADLPDDAEEPTAVEPAAPPVADPAPRAAEEPRAPDLALDAEEAAIADPEAPEADGTDGVAAPGSGDADAAATPDVPATDAADDAGADTATESGTDTAAGAEGDEPIVVGDPIPEGAIVVDSATDGAVVLDPDNTASTVEFGDDAAPADTGAGTDGDVAAATDAPTPAEAETLLTPEGFDADAIRALIADTDDLGAQQRSTLRALVEGAEANPDMIGPAVRSIRAALDLPPLE